MRWIKTATAARANRILNRVGEEFWQREYYDRWVRNDKELASIIRYIEQNPVTAGLAASAEYYRWSSAFITGGETAGATTRITDRVLAEED